MGSSALVSRNGFHVEPRCRVCRNDQIRKKVNDLLASGASYAMIVRALAADNAELDKCDRVTVDSVRNHCGRHFPVQSVAKATYRDILERRARENHIDFIEGVVTAITPLAFLETVMVKSYETLVDSDTKVDVHTGILAAGRLQAVIDSRDYSRELLVMKVKMDQTCNAVRSVVPQEMWGEIIEKLEEFEQHSEALDVGRTRSMTLTTTPTTRPSSSTRTTSFDLRSAPSPRAMGTAAGVDATVRRPVWCGQRRSGGLPAAGSAKRPPPGCAHCADSPIAQFGAAIALAAYPIPPGRP